MPTNAYRMAHSETALRGETVTQAHRDYCDAHGHKSQSKLTGEREECCVRCGYSFASAGVDEIEPITEESEVRDYAARVESFATRTAPGLYFDGTYGQTYNDGRLIDLAQHLGWQDKTARDVARRVMAHGADADEIDALALPEIADDALDFINDACERFGVVMTWVDGDLFVARHDVDDDAVTLSLCDCCISALANGDESGCRDYWQHVDGDDDHPSGVCAFPHFPASEWHVTTGIRASEHATDCPMFYGDRDAWDSEGCECEQDSDSLDACDGCGQRALGYVRRTLCTASPIAAL